MYNALLSNITAEQAAFLDILLFMVGALLFVGIGSLANAWLRPHRPNVEKLSTYESGESPTGSAWGQFNTRFYGIGLIFILFEVETVLLFPWAVVWGNRELHQATDGLWARYMALAGTVFIFILAVGLAYAWAKGYLTWIKPTLPPISFSSKVPREHYEQVNRHYASAQGRAINHTTHPAQSL